MSDFVLDASLALQMFLEDEADRGYSLAVLKSMKEKRALVPALWPYEVGNGLVIACRRKRISTERVEEILAQMRKLPIEIAAQASLETSALPKLALSHGLTNYDAAYLALAMGAKLPLATADSALRRAANSNQVGLFALT